MIRFQYEYRRYGNTAQKSGCPLLGNENISSCSAGGPSDPGSSSGTDHATEVSLRESTQAIEDAFVSGDADSALATLTETARSIYGEGIRGAPAEDLVEFGEALQSRRLNIYGETYAEYTYSFHGKY